MVFNMAVENIRKFFFFVFVLLANGAELVPKIETSTKYERQTTQAVMSLNTTGMKNSLPRNYSFCSPIFEANLIVRCPPEYGNQETIRKCGKGLFPLSDDDINVVVPVTSLKSRLHYANMHCAVCHNDTAKIEPWKPNARCLEPYARQNKKHTVEQIFTNLYFNHTLEKFALKNYTEYNAANCSLRPVAPAAIRSDQISCSPSTISDCPAASGLDKPNDCAKFNSSDGVTCLAKKVFHFYNWDCALCNGVPEHFLNLFCNSLDLRSSFVQKVFERRPSTARSGTDLCAHPVVGANYC